MKKELKFKKYISEYCEDIVVADGLEDAFLGIHHATNGSVAVYDKDLVIKTIMRDFPLTWEEAEDYAEFNIFNAKIGDQTPIFITRIYKKNWINYGTTK